MSSRSQFAELILGRATVLRVVCWTMSFGRMSSAKLFQNIYDHNVILSDPAAKMEGCVAARADYHDHRLWGRNQGFGKRA
jgi:hypothetical protein